MADRIFLFLYVENEELSALINLAIYILNPREKWPAHVTLAGPYLNKRKVPKDLTYDRKVSALGVSQFRSPKQNTIFVKVGTADLRTVWDKPDFPFNPHMTIYDGEDASLANLLYKRAMDARLFFKFFVTKIFVVSATPGQGTFGLRTKVNPKIMIETGSYSVGDLESLPVSKRVDLAILALGRAKHLSLQT